MRYKQSVHPVPMLFLLLFACVFLSSPAKAQSADKEKPKLKDFGSSLKRIKWDSKKKAAVETKPARDKRDDADIDVVHVETMLVAGDFLVLNSRGNPVRGLTRDDFAVTEDGKAQEVGIFSLGDDAAMARSIVLIMDYSGSLLPSINTSVEAAKTLVDQLGPKDILEKRASTIGGPILIGSSGRPESGRDSLLKTWIEQTVKEQSALATLSTITCGWIEFLEDPSQASEIYSRIFSDINRRYVIGYYPANKEHDGKLRKIKVEVKGHPEYMVMGRKSYYAPGPED